VNLRATLTLLGVVTVLLLGGVGGGYTWYWYQLADGMRDGLNIWMGQRRAEGFQAEAGPIAVSGFPFDVVATIGQAELGHGDLSRPRAWHWQGKDFVARLSPMTPWRILVATAAAQTLKFTDAAGRQKNLRAQADQTTAVIEVGGDGRLSRVQGNFHILGLSGSAMPAPIAVRRLKLEARPWGAAKQFAVDLSLSAEALHLPENTDQVLGDVVDIARANATVSGPPPTGWTKAAVSAWRDNGGTVEINAARIKWGTLDTTGTGTLALDQHMRPLFSATGALKGYVETIKGYKKNGLITPLNAAALTIALNMQRRDVEGRIKIAITGQNGELRIGPMKVARLKPLRFPGR